VLMMIFRPEGLVREARRRVEAAPAEPGSPPNAGPGTEVGGGGPGNAGRGP
jgi:hypothetical protein